MTPEQVAAHLVSHVRERGAETGANLGQEIRRAFPEFDGVRAAGSLTAFLRTHARELAVVDQRGDDLVWSAVVPDDLPELDLDQLVDEPSARPKGDPGAVRVKRGEFRGFRSLAHVDVEVERLTVLVGANGAGKTNVLDAFFRASRLTRMSPEALFSGDNAVGRIRTAGAAGPVRLRLLGTKDYQLEWSAEGQADGLPRHTLWAATGGKRTQVSTCATPALAQAFGPVVKLRLDASRITRPSYADEERPFVHHDGRNVAAVLADLAATDPERRAAIVDAVREVVPQVQDLRMPRAIVPRVVTETMVVDGRPFDREVRREQLGHRLEARIAGEWLPADQLSEGILLVIALQTVLRGVRPPKLLLIDDLDRALHPRAQRALVGHLKKIVDTNPQLTVIGTTHSPYVLDALEVESVRVVRLDAEGHTRVAPLASSPAWEEWKTGMTPGEFWNYVGEDWLEGGA